MARNHVSVVANGRNSRFRFNYTRAVQTQFREQLEAQPAKPLADHGAPPEPGVYVLYRNGGVVYVGKAISAGKGRGKLAKRLAEHKKRIMSAQNISVDEMTCRYLVVDEDWMANAAEEGVIREYGEPAWQGSGFGGHVPGAGRPGKKPRRWDDMFPPKSKGELEQLRRSWGAEAAAARRGRKRSAAE